MVTSVNIPPSWVAGRALQWWCTWAFFSPKAEADSPPYWGYKPQDTTFFSFQGSNSIQSPHPKNCCHPHTKNDPICCMTVAWQNKVRVVSLNVFFFRIHSPQEKLYRFSIGILKLTFWYSLDRTGGAWLMLFYHSVSSEPLYCGSRVLFLHLKTLDVILVADWALIGFTNPQICRWIHHQTLEISFAEATCASSATCASAR